MTGEITTGGPGEKSNRLARESSPYLRQHALDPVEWYPWGDEAFARARDEDRPIFLSIGYSTCHWCHVMEKESFSDREVAEVLNEHFVCIKVDREERPDVDQLYMQASLALAGTGGWPLTIVMTPDRLPFYAATYLPRESRFGLPGLLDILPRLAALWKEDREKVTSSAASLGKALSRRGIRQGRSTRKGAADRAFQELLLQYDDLTGGFGPAPRFPMPHVHLFLLRYGAWTGTRKAVEVSEKVLRSMARGGIHDQIGGGFHRYSTDIRWLVPHFEKMLYDQALAATAYTEAWQATGAGYLREIAEGCLSYVLRELAAPTGAFYAAQDADSEGEEGKFYLWTREEVEQALPPEHARVAFQVLRVTSAGNFIDPAAGGRTGKNVLSMTSSPEEAARTLNLSPGEARDRWQQAREMLRLAREKRERPFRDEKILTDWNGLAIGAFARAARAFGSPGYLDASMRAAEFLLTRMWDGGRLQHRYHDGSAGMAGTAHDYAFLINGLIELYLSSPDPHWLEEAIVLEEVFCDRFWDRSRGGYFTADRDAEDLFTRTKEFHDGAIPSPNSMAFANLTLLGNLTGKPAYTRRADHLSRIYSSVLEREPGSCGLFLAAFCQAAGPSAQVVVAGKHDDPDTRAMLHLLQTSYLPFAVWMLKEPGSRGEALAHIAPFTRDYRPIGGKTAAYVCRDFTCSSPVSTVAGLSGLLGFSRS
jgi:hypothetical protein